MMDVTMDVTFDRTPLKKNYTQVSNELVEDVIKKKRLSTDSLALMTMLYALYPEDVRLTSFNAWMDMLGWGINKLKKAISGLAELGYIHIKKNRDQYGRFTHNSYQFYHSPSDNPYFGRQSEPEYKTPENGVSSITQNPCYGDEEKYIFYYNTSSCMSCLSHPETEQKDFPQKESVETVENSESDNLVDCITSSIHEITAENQELKEKYSLISDVSSFITSLTDTVRIALQRLKHPNAKEKFIKSTIINQITEYKAKKPAPKQEKPAKESSYRNFQEVLAWIQSPYAGDMSFTCEEDFKGFEEMRKAEKCILPYEMNKNKKDTITALEFLMRYSDFNTRKEPELRTFADFISNVADCLAEIITTERVGKRVVHYYEMIDKLNKINRTHGLYTLVYEFYDHWQRIVPENEIRNSKRYMTTVLYHFISDYGLKDVEAYAIAKYKYDCPVY